MIEWPCASSGEDPQVSSDDADRRIAVILAADVAGYSRLVALDEATTLAALTTYHEVIAALISEHHGRIFNRAGDGLLAEFASAVAGGALCRRDPAHGKSTQCTIAPTPIVSCSASA